MALCRLPGGSPASYHRSDNSTLYMRHEHTHHERSENPGGHAAPNEGAEPPVEPGYPEHPEQPHPAGRLPGSDPSAKHPPHHGHGTHDAHEGGHDEHEGHSVGMFRSKFWISLLLTIPTVIWGHMLMRLTGYTPPAFPGSQWIAPAFGTAVFFYGGWVFLEGAWRELKDRLPGMMTLISLAITVAFVFSLVVTFGYPGTALWEELATLVTIMLLGHWMEMRSISQAQGALTELAKLLPSTAERLVDGRTETVAIADLAAGDLVLVRPGASVPADGMVREGRSAVNEAMITGESKPVGKTEGAEVIAGTVNGSGSLRVEVTKTGENTALAGIMRLVQQAQTSRSRAQALADRAAFILTLVAIGSAVLTLLAWWALGAPWEFTIERVVTVLVIACPHALGLAIPLVVAISTTLGAKGGLLVRDRRGLEEARNLNTVVFDKTGTLTLGEHRVVDLAVDEGISPEEALRLAAGVEKDSEHPVASAIVESARERGLTIPAASDFQSIAGKGVSATVEGRKLQGGGPNLLAQLRVTPGAELRATAERIAARGQGSIYLVEGERVLAVFAVADAIRPESPEAVRQLHENGIEVVMLTGDARPVAEAVAKTLGIETVYAQVLPDQKSAVIRELQGQGKRVAMVGDGVNDAPALLTSDVSVAIGAGTNVAVEAGDVVLVRSDPRDVPRIIELSKATYRKMIQNLWWAAGYNIVAIPLAAGVLQPWGIVLHPAVGAVLMSLSTVIVAINAQLLRRARL
ncbi:MAG TPA: copper-translocating P-type ATPase [Longimicrobiaceae bacterium]|nr:copper-translocating P-type ATPase [Longimicrobiaceae bacterium]